jgi:hypothetical protein
MMKLAKARIDRYTFEWANGNHKFHVADMRERIRKLDADADRPAREAKGECLYCYYFHTQRIGGAAMCSRECGLCDSNVTSGSTNCDVLCKECAKERGLCKHCGADLKLTNRRKVDLEVRPRNQGGTGDQTEG